MNRLFYILFLILIGSFTAFTQQNTSGKKPNIILILADDLGYSDLSCYGGEINTPNLDALSAGGVRMRNFYNNARCCPSRAGLLTGLTPHQAGIGNMVYADQGPGYRGFLETNTTTLAEVLKGSGYQTLMSGKWHVGHAPGQRPTDRGFDKFYGIYKHVDSYFKVLEGCEIYHNNSLLVPHTAKPVNTLHPEKEWYSTDAFTDYALEFLKEAKGNKQPYFLYLAYNAPHFPLEAPDTAIAKHAKNYEQGWDKMREEKFKRMKKMGLIDPSAALPPSENPLWDTLPETDKKEAKFRRAIYAAQVDLLDQNIGRLVAYLRKSGELDNTLILFMSDNGCSAEEGMFGMNFEKYREQNHADWKTMGGWSVSQGQCWANLSNTPFRLYKKFVHEGGIASPFIAHWPEGLNNAGTMSDQVGHFMDIMPTLVQLTAAGYPTLLNGHKISPMEGISLLSAWKNPQQITNESRAMGWEHIGNKAFRNGSYKLVMDPVTKQWNLYNLENDPYETIDLSKREPEKTKTMVQQYESWAKRTGVKPFPVKK